MSALSLYKHCARMEGGRDGEWRAGKRDVGREGWEGRKRCHSNYTGFRKRKGWFHQIFHS